jgi:very-short-patch-repair endonuclease
VADGPRDAHLTAQGYTVIRFTWRQLSREPMTVAARLAAALALNASTPVAP